MPTWPTITVEISFNSDCIPAFLQSDAVFNPVGFTWSGTAATWTDVTAYVNKLGYTRGRQRQLARTEAGTAYLELDNPDGRFDPENTSSPYGSDGTWARPGKHVRIRATYSGVTYDLFYGFVTKWEPRELSRSDSPTVRVLMSDMIAWFARGGTDWDYGSGLSGAIIGFLLQETLRVVSSSYKQLDDGGLVTQDAPAVTDGNPWSEIQAIADGEEGIVFVDGAGRFVYHDHFRRYNRERSIVLQALFDNGPGQPAGALPFTVAAYTRDDTDFFTRAIVTRTGGAPQTITVDFFGNALSDKYFVRPFSRSTRNFSNTSALNTARRLANWARSLFVDHGMAQHTSVTIEAGAGNAALWPKALGLTISDQIQVTERLYPNSRSRTIRSFVEGVTCDVDMQTLGWRVTYRLSRAVSGLYWSIKGKGVAFPIGSLAGDLYYREDLGLLCFYDGIRWLTAHEYVVALGPTTALPIAAAPLGISIAPMRSDYSAYITRVAVLSYVLTTNNGSNFWTLSLRRDATALTSPTTAAQAANTWTRTEVPINAVHTGTYFELIASLKTGSPGNLYGAATVNYRLVIP